MISSNAHECIFLIKINILKKNDKQNLSRSQLQYIYNPVSGFDPYQPKLVMDDPDPRGLNMSYLVDTVDMSLYPTQQIHSVYGDIRTGEIVIAIIDLPHRLGEAKRTVFTLYTGRQGDISPVILGCLFTDFPVSVILHIEKDLP